MKQLKHEADHLHPSSAEVMNEWRYTCTLLLCLHGVDTDNFTFKVYARVTFELCSEIHFVFVITRAGVC